ncbi:MAG: cell division septation protein DedD [Cocleimonas sp.]|jgi:cell division septation protein DedD
MQNTKLKISTSLIILVTVVGLSGCSTIGKIGKSARNLTNFGGNSATDIDNTLIIPPTLKMPPNDSGQPVVNRQPKATAKPKKAIYKPNENYYIIVGTYPDQLDALDTFTRISSIGLKGATMESRRTKAGSLLHMVRLGPYSNQEDIDKAKDSLTNTGMSQFKIVKN